MQILKRFLLCTVITAGICLAPVTKAYADPVTEQTANETDNKDTDQQEKQDPSQSQDTDKKLDTKEPAPLGASNKIEEVEVPKIEVPKGTVVGIQECEQSKSLVTEQRPKEIPTSGITSINNQSAGKTGINTLNHPLDSSDSTSSKVTSNATEKTAATADKKESKVPRMYINVSESRRKLLMKTTELAKKDKSYTGKSLKITGKNRELLEALVYGEAGGEGFIGQCLVAQAIRDTMLEENETSVKKIIQAYQYAGKTTNGTSQEVKDAVKFIFDDGGYAVQHRIIFFYAPKICRSSFHEKQKFIIEWKGHRFFDNSVWIERDNKKK